MIILGAGLSGLICGALNAQAEIYEQNPSTFVSHRAVLRFRDDKIARALGLTFRKVTVRKSIWVEGGEVGPSPRIANLYSRKVRGVIAENSIWNIGASERYIAPDNLHEILAGICGDRVHWETSVTADMIMDLAGRGGLISTIPIPFLLKLIGLDSALQFQHQPINVYRYHVPECDVFQTVYFPSQDTDIYRATLTGNLLTIESTKATEAFEDVELALGINNTEWQRQGGTAHKQSFGKIVPVLELERKALLHRITREFGIYSLGRFATWRNILLDDVYDDIAAIRRMLTQSQYDISLEMTR